MPSPQAFVRGFGINKRMKLQENQVSSIKIDEIVIEKYREYHFEINLKFKENLTEKQVSLLRIYLHGHQIIYSRYDNPYDCYISKIIYDGDTAKIFGVAKRVFFKK